MDALLPFAFAAFVPIPPFAVLRPELADLLDLLAIASGNLVNTFSPEIVIYGGGVIEAVGDIFLEKIVSEVDKYCMPSIRSTVQFRKAALGDDSILYGALSMIESGKK